jgi:hypothetical protein
MTAQKLLLAHEMSEGKYRGSTGNGADQRRPCHHVVWSTPAVSSERSKAMQERGLGHERAPKPIPRAVRRTGPDHLDPSQERALPPWSTIRQELAAGQASPLTPPCAPSTNAGVDQCLPSQVTTWPRLSKAAQNDRLGQDMGPAEAGAGAGLGDQEVPSHVLATTW